jgi:nitrite reductase/ring-hydroxylating ferredoxin subunit
MRRSRLVGALGIVAVGAVLVVPAAMVTPSRSPGAGDVEIPLSAVPAGVSARTVGARPVFLVRRGSSVTAFLTNVHHIPGEHVLWWCPNEQLFVSPTHAEAFDADGTVIGGPTQRGLDRLATTSEAGSVTVHTRRVMLGSTVRRDRSPAPGLGAVGGWNSGPLPFCSGPIVGGRPAAAAPRSAPTDSGGASPAQPSSPTVRRGAQCSPPGATAYDEHGMADDCEPDPDGNSYWTIA